MRFRQLVMSSFCLLRLKRRERYGSHVTIDDHSAAWLHTSPFAAGKFAQGPLTQPPPPTGSLAPPPAPDLPIDAQRPTAEQPPAAAEQAPPANGTRPAEAAPPPSTSTAPPLGTHLAEGLRTELLALLGRAGGQLQAV